MLMKVVLAVAASLGLGALALMPQHSASPDTELQSTATAPPKSASPTPVAAPPSQASGKPALLPSRLLECDLGRITNFDPNQVQGPEDYKFEGRHSLRMFLPAAPVRANPPPSALKPPEPVDARTRILADPDNLSRGANKLPFYRVVDLWPERVEMVTPITDTSSNLIILDGYDAQSQTVNLFMTAAQDGMTFDQDHLYAGRCAVTLGRAAELAVR